MSVCLTCHHFLQGSSESQDEENLIQIPHSPPTTALTHSLTLERALSNDNDYAVDDAEMHALHMIDLEARVDDLYVHLLKTRYFGLGE